MIQFWLTWRPATLAALMIYSCIISLVGISLYSDNNLLACLDTSWTYAITTGKSTYNIHVIIIYATFAIVLLVKLEEKVVLAKEVGHVIVE